MSHAHYEIEYTSKWTGKQVVKQCTNHQSDAVGWARNLAEDNNCKATCRKVNSDGSSEHVHSEGSDGKNKP